MQTQGENLKPLQAKFDDRGEVAGSWLLLICTLKFNKDQQEAIRSAYQWYYCAVEGQAPEILYYRNQSEQLKKSLVKNTAVLRASKELMITPDYKFQPWAWNPDLEDKLSMLCK